MAAKLPSTLKNAVKHSTIGFQIHDDITYNFDASTGGMSQQMELVVDMIHSLKDTAKSMQDLVSIYKDS